MLRCTQAARAVWVTDRAWALVRLAVDLRAQGDQARALAVLGTAWELDAGDEVMRAIETVAIACHCDMGTHEVAVRIEQQASALPPDLYYVYYARASLRLYSELHEVTGEEVHGVRRNFYSMLVLELQMVPQLA